jgi:site-specific DNA-cytosine methylase
MNEKPTHLDLCSGTGAFSIAFQAEGFETIGFAEIDEYCCKLLAQNWPHVKNYGDIRNVPRIGCSVLTAGVPCQPISIAGRRLGAADHRYIWPAVLDVIKRCGPDWVVIENVANVTNLFLAAWQDDLEGCGYQSQSFDLPSCAVGLSSVERHVWLVAARGKKQLQGRSQECISGDGQVGHIVGLGREIAHGPTLVSRGWNLPLSGLLRSTKGIPNFRNRIAAIGNAVPPPIAQVFARAIRQLI